MAAAPWDVPLLRPCGLLKMEPEGAWPQAPTADQDWAEAPLWASEWLGLRSWGSANPEASVGEKRLMYTRLDASTTTQTAPQHTGMLLLYL